MRHGDADHLVAGVIASEATERSNPPKLTAIGRKQAEESGEELEGKGISTIYSSPYKRTLETALIVASKLGLDAIKDDRLKETNFTYMDGRPVREYKEAFQKEEDKLTKSWDGGESLFDVRKRVERFLNDIHQKYKGEKILIISHGDPLVALESVLRDINGEDILQIPHYRVGEWRMFREA